MAAQLLLANVRLPDLAGFDLSRLAKVGNSSDPVAAELLRLFAEHLPWVAVSDALGMTGTTGLGVADNGTTSASTRTRWARR